jgi:hypothetical protein
LCLYLVDCGQLDHDSLEHVDLWESGTNDSFESYKWILRLIPRNMTKRI